MYINSISSSKYQVIRLNEISSILESYGFVRKDLTGSNEVVYQKPIVDDIICVVYTSVRKDGGLSRGRGQDRIRIVLITKSGRGVSRGVKVNRTQNWKYNFIKGLQKVLNSVTNTYCDVCGSIMILRGSFLGCSNFPSCRNTQSIY